MLQLKRFKAAIAALLLCTTAFSATAVVSAAEITLDIDFVPITGDGFVADTMNGVEAQYNLYGPTLYCSDLIPRYYQEVYGLSLTLVDGKVRVNNSSDIYFVETDTPKQGDILYGSPQARGKGYSHWALVKSVEVGETITCFEQNWRWNGQAGINRVIPYEDSCYVAYTMVSRSGNLPAMQGVKGLSTVSEWALPYVTKAVEQQFISEETDFQSDISRTDFVSLAVAVAKANGLETVGETTTEQAMSLGLISSEMDGFINRQTTAVIAARLGNLLGTLTQSTMDLTATYADLAQIGFWALEDVTQLTANGLMGPADGNFGPLENMTYEQAIRLLLTTSQSNMLDVTATAPRCSAAEVAQLTGDLLKLAR